MFKKQIALIFLSIGIGLLITLLYINKASSKETYVFSPYTLLFSSWEKYRAEYINQDGRVIDYSRSDMTTSEGQSYAMLRAVWMDDKETFDRVWKWTQDNLNRPEDELFAWSWGGKEDGSYGILGSDAATDGDSDIALALLFASTKWNEPSYRDAAIPIIKDIWECCVTEVEGKRYYLPGKWANSQNEMVLNPSYFMPYAWKIFGQVDTEHDWVSLIDPSYEVLHLSGQISLADKKGVGLPPDWLTYDKNTKQWRAASQPTLRTTYAYDAMRTPWRIALDYRWSGDERALNYLKTMSHLSTLYQNNGKLTGEYEHDGTPITDYESPAMYATALGYFMMVEPEQAKKMYDEKIVALYSNDTYTFKPGLNYYDQNWLWFSLALYHDQLPNLFEREEP